MTMQIPAHAAERLKGLRSSMHSTGVFTSDFSVNEFLLVRKAGFEPIKVNTGRALLKRMNEAANIDLILVDADFLAPLVEYPDPLAEASDFCYFARHKTSKSLPQRAPRTQGRATENSL